MIARHQRVRRHARRRICAALAVAALATVAPSGVAQLPNAATRTRIVQAPPSRADSMLAVGRLAAAEEALYAAVSAHPNTPSPRGALGRYLASRGRFTIAEVLYLEAQRFGADRGTVRRAIAQMAPWRLNPPAGSGVESVVPFVAIPDGPVLGTVRLRTALNAEDAEVAGRSGRLTEVRGGLDMRVTGVVVGGRAASGPRAGSWRADVHIGERVISGVQVTRDSTLAADSVRFGLDVLWGLHPIIDERAGTLTLGRATALTRTPTVQAIPVVIDFPGVSLVPRPGVAPRALGSRAGRAILRGRRWRIDEPNAVIVVDR